MKQECHGKQDCQQQHVTRRPTDQAVEGTPPMDAYHLMPRPHMGHEIQQRKNSRPMVAINGQNRTTGIGGDALQEVEQAAEPLAQNDDERALSGSTVGVAIAIIVDYKQRIDRQGTSAADPPHGRRKMASLYVVRATDRDHAENAHTSKSPRPQ